MWIYALNLSIRICIVTSVVTENGFSKQASQYLSANVYQYSLNGFGNVLMFFYLIFPIWAMFNCSVNKAFSSQLSAHILIGCHCECNI